MIVFRFRDEHKYERPRSDSNRRITDLQSVSPNGLSYTSQGLTQDANAALPNSLPNFCTDDVELTLICQTWATLPDSVRTNITGLVRAFSGAATENTANANVSSEEPS